MKKLFFAAVAALVVAVAGNAAAAAGPKSGDIIINEVWEEFSEEFKAEFEEFMENLRMLRLGEVLKEEDKIFKPKEVREESKIIIEIKKRMAVRLEAEMREMLNSANKDSSELLRQFAASPQSAKYKKAGRFALNYEAGEVKDFETGKVIFRLKK